ncbi:MAG: copper chaperone PCu(A)C, partial [Gammaproteobacteria bacterium]|nr:copper chaperone PCu(A)C [Gammaproteobacteria bacterium]
MARPYGPVVAGMLAILVASCDGSGHDRQSLGSPLKFDNAWVRVPVAGRTVTAAYCDVINPGDMPVDIVGFETDHPGLRVEIHESIEHDGMMQMRRLARVTIPA